MSIIDERFQELIDLIPRFKKQSENSITATSKMIVNAFKGGNKILICGNGGSAADSQHFAAEFVNAFSRSITRPGLFKARRYLDCANDERIVSQLH